MQEEPFSEHLMAFCGKPFKEFPFADFQKNKQL